MLIQDVRPSSLVGIKRLARQIRNVEGVPLNQALQRAAQAASFSNFEHARRMLRDVSPASCSGQQLFLTAYWTDRETHESGRETLEIQLSKPLADLCTKSEMKLVRALCNMRPASPDHLVKDMVCPSQDFARRQICQTVGALRFMEATGLRPSDYQRAQAGTKHLDCDLPDQDHVSEWFDPTTGRFISIDEPYSDAVITPERAEWAARNGWLLHASAWAGMYFPYRCSLFVASDASNTDFAALTRKIDAIAAPVTAERWEGVSAGNHTVFVSPLAASSQDKRRARAKGTIVPRSSKQTIPYMRSFIGQARKPNAKMTLAEHRLAGGMVRALLQSCHKPWVVNDRLGRLQKTLVDWLYADVPERQFGGMDPIDLYYDGIADNDPLVVQAGTTQGVVDLLADLKGLLTNAYPDCAPLRRITRHIEMSLAIIENANAASDGDWPNRI